MTEADIWVPHKRRRERVQQPRRRRDCLGELVQIDGSEHDWFEGRGPRCTLLVFVDDATSQILQLSFAESESTHSYFRALRGHVERYGKPQAYYSDKHSVFRVTAIEPKGGRKMTQFGRALDELNIDIIHANSPAAKGRVERANGVLQDRLVKEMRLRGIDSITSANEYVNEFIESYNKKFGKAARVRLDAHRPLLEHECLDDICTVREERKVGRQLTIRYKTCEILLEPSESSLKAQGQKVQIYERSEAAIEVQFKGEVLPQRPAESEAQRNIGLVVEQKRLTETLRKIRTRQAERDRQLLASGTLSERQEAVLANHLLRQEQNPWGAELR